MGTIRWMGAFPWVAAFLAGLAFRSGRAAVVLPGLRSLAFSAGLVDSEDFALPADLSVRSLLELADTRLYQAKAGGRNSLCA